MGFRKDYLPIEDLHYLRELLKTDLPLRSCLELLKEKKSERIYKIIIEKLDQGYMIEEIIPDYLPVSIRPYISSLISGFSFRECLDLSLIFYEKNEDYRKRIEKAVIYPLVLLFLALGGLYLFDQYGIDIMLSLMGPFLKDRRIVFLFRYFFRILIYIFFFSLLVLFGGFIYFSSKKRIVFFYVLLSRFFPDSLFHIYYCSEFISLFLATVDLGYKTKDALQILRNLHHKPVISFLSYHLDDRLLQGDSLKEAATQEYYDKTLIRFLDIASYTSDFNGILGNYVEFSSQKISLKMKRLATGIQLFSYLLIGAVIIFIYLLLFMPMQAIVNY